MLLVLLQNITFNLCKVNLLLISFEYSMVTIMVCYYLFAVLMYKFYLFIFSNCNRENKYTVKISTSAMGEKGNIYVTFLKH